MVKMLHGEFPGNIKVESKGMTSESVFASDGVLCIIGPPGCGKTTLRNKLQKSAKFLAGVESFDMSQIMDWHKDPINNSPLRSEFSGNADGERRSGNLVNDALTCDGLMFRLEAANMDNIVAGKGPIRRLVLSGVPRTVTQYQRLTGQFPNLKLVGINLDYNQANSNRLRRIANGESRPDDVESVFKNRWKRYHESTEPFINWAQENGLILMINFKTMLSLKCIHAIKHMGLSDCEYKSMDKQIRNPDCDAHWEIKRVESPTEFRKHMQTQIELHSAGQHAPQIEMARQFLSLSID